MLFRTSLCQPIVNQPDFRRLSSSSQLAIVSRNGYRKVISPRGRPLRLLDAADAYGVMPPSHARPIARSPIIPEFRAHGQNLYTLKVAP